MAPSCSSCCSSSSSSSSYSSGCSEYGAELPQKHDLKLQNVKISEKNSWSGFHVKKSEDDTCIISSWDVGGHDMVVFGRRMIAWRNYCPDAQQGLIFVVNGNDRDHIAEARPELHRMLNEDELRDAVLLVFANKQDLLNSMSVAEIIDKLGLLPLRRRCWRVYLCSAATGEGMYDGLDWLNKSLAYKVICIFTPKWHLSTNQDFPLSSIASIF
ncbi:ADP-ribosylation factor 1-like [Triticum dicoccoides]|uniref:ADP-ribosylation factor 1-like n=1 Tax=Triticum dicoccoides TaxID=85692 RepID=UPI00189168F2|nr:ADP-ribosylation factor 1-like [Triticum dicoccoides]